MACQRRYIADSTRNYFIRLWRRDGPFVGPLLSRATRVIYRGAPRRCSRPFLGTSKARVDLDANTAVYRRRICNQSS